jgi:predicted CoA-binding protein
MPEGVESEQGEACSLPVGKSSSEAEMVSRMLQAKRIAVVGLSDDPSRPSYDVATYMRSTGAEILPVNPNHETVMGLKCYASLHEVPGPIDLVDVFRRPEFCVDVARDAVEVGAKGVWLQSGIRSAEAREIARRAGIDYVENRCLKIEHMFRGS